MADSAQTDEMSTGSLFSYDSVPLSDSSTEIRLLELHPASSYTDGLYCRIYTAPISQLPSYIALSYVWGDSTRAHEISVVNQVNDGRAFTNNTARSPLPLTSSLDTCLRHLRELHHRGQLEPRPLWIDQICINQEDVEERSFQVLLMKDIYSSAHQVIVWLGPAADGSDKVMDAVAEIGQEFIDKICVPYSDEHMLSVGDLVKENIEQPGVVAFLGKTVTDILELKKEGSFTCWVKRSWFTRVWTIQEFCLCSDTVFACGYKVIPERLFSALNDFTKWTVSEIGMSIGLGAPGTRTVLHSLMLSGLDELNKLFERRRHIQYLHQKETLQELLVDIFIGPTLSFVTDKRDKVYGLLGLAGDADELGIRPDYSTSTTNAQVFTQTARAIIQKNSITQKIGGLHIIRYGSLGRRSYAQSAQVMSSTKNETELPSWVPEWNNETRRTYQVERTTLFSACGKFSIADLVPTSSPTILGVRGFCVDTIANLGDQSCFGQWLFARDGPKQILGFFDSVKRLLNISKQNKCAKNIYATTIHHDAALWRVPIEDQYFTFRVNQPSKRADSKLESLYLKFIAYYEDWASREDDWKDYIAALDGRDKQADLAMRIHIDELLAEGYNNMLGVAGKRPYLTKNGYLGMCPGHCQPGDKVVVFHGDTIPYVVRPVPEKGDNTYLLMGGAYCDGIMDGELADTAEREDFYLI